MQWAVLKPGTAAVSSSCQYTSTGGAVESVADGRRRHLTHYRGGVVLFVPGPKRHSQVAVRTEEVNPIFHTLMMTSFSLESSIMVVSMDGIMEPLRALCQECEGITLHFPIALGQKLLIRTYSTVAELERAASVCRMCSIVAGSHRAHHERYDVGAMANSFPVSGPRKYEHSEIRVFHQHLRTDLASNVYWECNRAGERISDHSAGALGGFFVSSGEQIISKCLQAVA